MPIHAKKLNGNSWNDNIKKYNEIIRKVSKQKNIHLVDIEKKFTDRSKKNYLNENGKWLHLSKTGNYIYFKIVLDTIKNIIMTN